MNPKPFPNDREYLRVLRQLTPQQRLRKAFELSDLTRRLFRQGLRQRFATLSEDEFQRLYLERLKQCHNSSF
ncbi:MAG: hypothetical protein IAG10_25080 [Planctomycetaceae bacterium]|nr:hypothetical protein [Planctomycetaceae bacterium]